MPNHPKAKKSRDLSKQSLREELGSSPPIAVSMREFCALTGIGLTTGWKLAREGRLKTFKVGGCRRIFLDSIDNLK